APLVPQPALSRRAAVTGVRAEPAPPGAVPQARVGMPSALFGRLVISWESHGLARPTRSPGRSSAGMAAVPEGCGNSIPPADRRIHAVSGPRQALFSDALSVRCEWRLRRPRPVLLDELLPLFLAPRGDRRGAHCAPTR